MLIVDAHWTPKRNLVVIQCPCGLQFRHPSTRWKATCPGCHESENLRDLRNGHVRLDCAFERIGFYTTRGPYGVFSNFSPHAFQAKGERWPTSEHYFQAMKFEGTEHVDAVRNAPSPKEAARRGRQRTRPLRPDWEDVKDDVMRAALDAKFSSHPDLAEILLATCSAEIIEETRRDYYWGCGTKRTGRNMLGKLLVELREQLRQRELM